MVRNKRWKGRQTDRNPCKERKKNQDRKKKERWKERQNIRHPKKGKKIGLNIYRFGMKE